jgi:hypothetical protein
MRSDKLDAIFCQSVLVSGGKARDDGDIVVFEIAQRGFRYCRARLLVSESSVQTIEHNSSAFAPAAVSTATLPRIAPPDSAAPALGRPRPHAADRERLIAAVVGRVFGKGDAEYGRYGLDRPQGDPGPRLADFLFAVEEEPHLPDDVFGGLRWGGQFVYITSDRRRASDVLDRFGQRGFVAVRGPEMVRIGAWGLPIPYWSKKVYFFVARKVFLIRPREITDRFTYHVQLVDDPSPGRTAAPAEQAGKGGLIVQKEIPSLDRVIGRLRARFTDLPLAVLEKRALNFTEKIFPLFLTREAALLKVLERELPPEYAMRFPRVLDLDKDSRGYVRRLWMNWLRNGRGGGEPLSQLEFARQSADLLCVLHEKVGIIHLDLRLDNFVITEHGVGFVDFGSAVRETENIRGNPLLSTLFDELMRTSQIQRMLERMKTSGSVTSHVINDAHHKVDKAVDLFYLAVQLNCPHANPDLRDLIRFDPKSREAIAIARLTQDILKPADPPNPPYRTARDLLNGVLAIEHELAN